LKPNWNPKLGDSYTTKDWNDFYIIRESVSFVPDITIDCNPPYTKGKRDSCWVKYRDGNRPKTKEDWQFIVGMSLQTMI